MRPTRPRRPLPAALVALTALAVALAGCSGSPSTPTPTTSPATTAAAVGTHPVATRTLDLTDPSRVTDATPGKAGGETPGRHLPTTVWYPSDGGGPYPVVVFSHGVKSRPSAYQELLSGWASAGFVVAAPTFPLTNADVPTVLGDILQQPADVSFVLTRVLALGTTAGDPLDGLLDAAHVAAAGHSGGAITTLGLLRSCCREQRLSAAVVLAGTLTGIGSDLASPGVATLFEHGTADDTVPYAQGQAAFAAAPAPKAFLGLREATHVTPWSKPSDPAFATVLASTTDFLRWRLSGDEEAHTALETILRDPKRADLVDDRLGG